MGCSVGVVFGGQSGEHEVSLRSARSIIDGLEKASYRVIPIGVTKNGDWVLIGEISKTFEKGIVESTQGRRLAFIPGGGREGFAVEGRSGELQVLSIDVIFPVLHGPYGEDGTIQGLLEMVGIPYVGGGVLASSIGMDKSIMKTIFVQAGLPIVPHQLVYDYEWTKNEEMIISVTEERLGYPMFVKPCNLGSSVGVTKACNRSELTEGIHYAFEFDRKILIEKGLEGIHEVECSVLGNDELIASVVGEIVPAREFYDYEAKYIDPDSRLITPAPLDEDVSKRVQDLAKRAFRAIDCSGMARVDFFVIKSTKEIIINEINTIPGFTSISMYPKLLSESGIPFEDLVRRLVELAVERYKKRRLKLTTCRGGKGIDERSVE